eukprot:354662-Chlamydomonas_euryale.AAC.2
MAPRHKALEQALRSGQRAAASGVGRARRGAGWGLGSGLQACTHCMACHGAPRPHDVPIRLYLPCRATPLGPPVSQSPVPLFSSSAPPPPSVASPSISPHASARPQRALQLGANAGP